MPIVYIDPNIEMVEIATKWRFKSGKPMPKELRKRMFKSWIDVGWVDQEPEQMKLF